MKEIRIPTLEEFMGEFKRPNYFDDPRTPEEMKQLAKEAWRKSREEEYFRLYGQEKIISLGIKKEGE